MKINNIKIKINLFKLFKIKLSVIFKYYLNYLKID